MVIRGYRVRVIYCPLIERDRVERMRTLARVIGTSWIAAAAAGDIKPQ